MCKNSCPVCIGNERCRRLDVPHYAVVLQTFKGALSLKGVLVFIFFVTADIPDHLSGAGALLETCN